MYNYPPRSFSTSLSWSIPTLTSDVITNDLLNNLYSFFVCSAGQIGSVSVQNAKKGLIQNLPESMWYIQKAIYCLRGWYNGAFNFVGPFSYGGSYTTSFYWEENNTETLTTQPLAVSVPHGSSRTDLINNLLLALPQGYTVVPFGSTGITIQTVNPTTQYLYVQSFNGSALQNAGWFMIDFWSCIPYSKIQQIVQDMTVLCNCPNCQNTTIIETDNIYTSLGQTPPPQVSREIVSYSNPLYN